MRVALLASHSSYRISAFQRAADQLGIDLVVVTDATSPLVPRDIGVVDATVAADDWGVTHPAALDKRVFRAALRAAGLRQPIAGPMAGPPWIVKPANRSGGEGVHLIQTPHALLAAIASLEERYGEEPMVEEFIAGPEVIVEAIVVAGRFHVVASFDKPGPRDGPLFPETLLVGPSAVEASVVSTAAQACAAIGLTDGPAHVEIVASDPPVVLEVHARSIGGRCSTAVDVTPSLETLILQGALGLPLAFRRGVGATGVSMLHVPRAGRLVGVDGLDVASAIAGVTGVEITALSQWVEPLPQRGDYLGFIFAAAATNAEVECALRSATNALTYRFEGP